MTTQSKTIRVAGIGDVLIERSARAKRVNLSVRPFKGVRIAVPLGVSFQHALTVAAAKAPWIRKHLGRMAMVEQQIRDGRAMPCPDPDDARRILVRRLAQLADLHGFAYNRVSVRRQKTRWGSCSHQNNISLNMRLVQLPDPVVDYVLMHELMHTRIKNHSRQFWEALVRCLPAARQLDRELHGYWTLLIA
ncbi:MAG: M48 family metallopeptidase [Desulfatitalea sp.]|nr:M48 family metallopeptidase [Desulfatitalea sp.]